MQQQLASMYHPALRSREQQYGDAVSAYAHAQRSGPPFQTNLDLQRGSQRRNFEYNRSPIFNKAEFAREVTNGRPGLMDFARERLSPNHHDLLLTTSGIRLDRASLLPEYSRFQPNDQRMREVEIIRDQLGGLKRPEDWQRERLHPPVVSRRDVYPELLDTLATQQRYEPRPRVHPRDENRTPEGWYENMECKREWRSTGHDPLPQRQTISPVRQIDPQTLLRLHEIGSNDHVAYDDGGMVGRYRDQESGGEWRSANRLPSIQLREDFPVANNDVRIAELDAETARYSPVDESLIEELYNDSDSVQEWRSEDGYLSDEFPPRDGRNVRDRLGGFDREQVWDRLQPEPNHFQSGFIRRNASPVREMRPEIDVPVVDLEFEEEAPIDEDVPVKLPVKNRTGVVRDPFYLNKIWLAQNKKKYGAQEQREIRMARSKARRDFVTKGMLLWEQLDKQPSSMKDTLEQAVTHPSLRPNILVSTQTRNNFSRNGSQNQARVLGNPRATVSNQPQLRRQMSQEEKRRMHIESHVHGTKGPSLQRVGTLKVANAPKKFRPPKRERERIAALSLKAHSLGLNLKTLHQTQSTQAQKLIQLNKRVLTDAWKQAKLRKIQQKREKPKEVPKVEQVKTGVSKQMIRNIERAQKFEQKRKLARAQARAHLQVA